MDDDQGGDQTPAPGVVGAVGLPRTVAMVTETSRSRGGALGGPMAAPGGEVLVVVEGVVERSGCFMSDRLLMAL
ncbi:hypothetical protein [Streptomyces sp. NPDC018059]|uniref:hypothetical protein n=1 Tax=Streptomyces sp. NPDC018059 TaxID=3365041 RepID=UPI003797BCE5